MSVDRRSFLAAGGGLVVAFAIGPNAVAQGRSQAPRATDLPGSLGKQPFLDGWIRIGADGKYLLCFFLDGDHRRLI